MSTIKYDRFSEVVDQMCSVKKVFLEILRNSREKTRARAPSLIKLQAQACNFIKKETLAQIFSSEFCETSKAGVDKFLFRRPIGHAKK